MHRENRVILPAHYSGNSLDRITYCFDHVGLRF